MINLMLGSPRSGKSYESTVYHILPALESGRVVITNLPVNVDVFATIDAEYAKRLIVLKDEGGVKAFSKLEHWHSDWRDPATNRGPLFVVDECQFVMHRGDTPRWLQELASMHGHYGYDWLLITHSYGKIDKDICEMVQFTYYVRKKLAWGEPDAYIRKVYDGLKRPSSQEIEISERKYKPAYFKFYKSHTHSAGAVTEFAGSDVSSRFVKWKWATRFMLCLFLFFVCGALYTHFTQKKSAPSPKPVAVSVHADASQPSAAHSDYVARADKPAQMDADPYAGMHIAIKASIVGAGKSVWLFGVSRDGQELMQQTGAQLAEAGYSVRSVNECLVIIDHPKLTRPMYVYCEVGQPAGQGAATKAAPISIKAPDVGSAMPFSSGSDNPHQLPSMGSPPRTDLLDNSRPNEPRAQPNA